MSKIQIEYATPGDILATNVESDSGILILAAGQKLTRDHIEKLKKFGVRSIDVAGRI